MGGLLKRIFGNDKSKESLLESSTEGLTISSPTNFEHRPSPISRGSYRHEKAANQLNQGRQPSPQVNQHKHHSRDDSQGEGRQPSRSHQPSQSREQAINHEFQHSQSNLSLPSTRHNSSASNSIITSNSLQKTSTITDVNTSADSPMDPIDAQALAFYNGKSTEVSYEEYAMYLGSSEESRKLILASYLELFNFTDKSVLKSMRMLCERLYMRGESQVLDRLMEAFAKRWCACNPRHGFKSSSIIYTMASSILILNTDLHTKSYPGFVKMSRAVFVDSVLDSVTLQFADEEEKHKDAPPKARSSKKSNGPTELTLVNDQYPYNINEWKNLLTNLLKAVYASVDMEPLQLANKAPRTIHSKSSTTSLGSSSSRDKAAARASWIGDSDLANMSDYDYARLVAASSGKSSGRLSKRRSMIAMDGRGGDALGFASALRTTMIHEEEASAVDKESADTTLGGGEEDDDKLALRGPPWAKEGLLQYQFIEASPSNSKSSRSKKSRGWQQVFVVVQRGSLRVFTFETQKQNRRHSMAVSKVGAGNWLDNATLLQNVSLCHTYAQGTHKRSENTPDSQWTLRLPGGGEVQFRAGTKDIAEEYIYTCNYWASRVSKEPLIEAVSSIEYGWNRPVQILHEFRRHAKKDKVKPPVHGSNDGEIITIGKERMNIKEWKPPMPSVSPSELNEIDQLDALQRSIATVQLSLEQHNANLDDVKQLFVASESPTSARALTNWERRSRYLLQEAVKYENYVAVLERAMREKNQQ